MIGIIGPHDSVTLAQQVAVELGREAELLGLAYKHTEDAVSVARSLEASCDVLLFTGQVPYQSARLAGPWRAELQVISHSGADLYRMIALVLKERNGKFPRVSVDALEAETVRGVFRDMGLPVPEVIIPVIDGSEKFVFESVESTARTHVQAVAEGSAEAVLTCLAGTHTLLLEAGVLAWRIEHARVTIVEALQRAWLTSEVARSKGNLLAVAIVATEVDASLSEKQSSIARAAVKSIVLAQARKLSAQVTTNDDEHYVLITTQAAVQTMISRHRDGHKSLIGLATKPVRGVAITLGIGVGQTFVTAHDAAEKATRLASSTGEPTIAHGDGTVTFVLGAENARGGITLQETSAQALDLAQRTGLGPLSLRRLAEALGRADGTKITAQNLGEYYGVMPRSARRMLTALVSAGYAREVGVRAAVGAGRPHVVYDVDVPRLRASLAGVALLKS